MSFDKFKVRVKGLIAKAGGNLPVEFGEDREGGFFTAKFGDGTTIIGSASCTRVEVRWGAGHCALASI